MPHEGLAPKKSEIAGPYVEVKETEAGILLPDPPMGQMPGEEVMRTNCGIPGARVCASPVLFNETLRYAMGV